MTFRQISSKVTVCLLFITSNRDKPLRAQTWDYWWEKVSSQWGSSGESPAGISI